MQFRKNRFFAGRAGHFRPHVTIEEPEQGGNGLNPIPQSETRIGLHIHLEDLHPPLAFGGNSFQHRSEFPASWAPSGREVHQDGLRGAQYFLLKFRLINFTN